MSHTGEERYKSPAKAIMAGVSDLFRRRADKAEMGDGVRLDGKKVLLTGASSGLGFATAVELAKRGAHVIMAVRSGIPDKGEEVKRRSGAAAVDMIRLDLADLHSLRGFVEELKGRFSKVDVVIWNAGLVTRHSRETDTGLDEMFTVNYFAKFILVNLCLEAGCLNTGGDVPPRIVFVASESHRNAAGFDWDGFGKVVPYGIRQSVAMYGYYKLLLVTLAQELSRRVNSGNKVKFSVFSLCPGPVNSRIAREAPLLFQPLLKLIFWIFFRSPVKACRPVIHLAAAREMNNTTGRYMFLMQYKDVDPKAADPANGRRLWELSEALMKEILSNGRPVR